MARMTLAVLAALCACAYAFPEEPTGPITRNTIFADEKFEGAIFENIDSIEELSRSSLNASAFRLPTTTKPTHYDVLWQININSLQMSGSVQITLHATQTGVNEIVIHAAELTIPTVGVYLSQGNTNVPITFTLEPESGFMRVRLREGYLTYNVDNPVLYKLDISFNAPLRTDMYGIYQSWYRNNPSNNSEPIMWMASTQFQATSARFAFPCYDEPSFKATFDITIRRPIGFKSWSCTRQDSTITSLFPGYQEDIYTRTPVMSTYLLALIVAEYDSKTFPENAQNDQLKYEVIARPGAMSANQGDYAFEVGQELLKEMNDHTAIDFYEVNANLKMTQAAIPDFSAGAMENWGLLTYREAYLMYDPENTNSNFKQLIAYILSHEIAHMWFGNLVTNDWWDVLWLNEGFARYYQYFLTDWVENYMGLGTRFITEQVHTALIADSSNNPHSLSTSNIGSPASVSGMFSTLSYNKGAAVIRMTEHLLGFEVHRAGLRNYLRDNQFKTTLPINLFEALQNAAETSGAITAYGPDFSVIDYYKSWTEQSGHPVLNVQVNHTSGLMTISQRRFNINTGYAITNNNNYIVPINFATASNLDFSNTKPTHIIRNAVTIIPRGSVGDEWVIFNKQQTGFYRVNYDDYTWDLITMQLRGPNMTQIHEFNRAQIVDDVFQFARSGLMTYTRAFNILSYLENEKAYTPWVAAINGFNWLRNRLAGSPALAQLEALIIKWSANVIQDLGYGPPPANEAFMTSYLRFQLAPVLCAINAPNCNEAANTQFRALVNQGTPVHVDSRNWVYCNALRRGTAADFNFLWQRYQTHNVYTEKILLLQVLGCAPDSASLETFLNAIVSVNYIVRPQDYTTAFGNAVNGNEGNTQIVFQYIRNNLDAVTAAFGGAVTPLSYISARLRSEAEIVAFETWANETQAALGDDYQAVYNNAGATRNSLAWATAVQSDLNNYFVNGDQPVSYTVSPPTVPPQVSTVTPPPLVEPVTPELETPPSDSAVTNYMSVLIVALAVILNIVV